MSGGHFNHSQYHLVQISEDIDTLVRNNCIPDEYGYATNFTPETLAKFEEAIKALKVAHAMVQRVDWLVSGDDGEDTFHKRWEEEVASQLPKRKMFKKKGPMPFKG
jgi:Asp-tRNA(Asn)/Glu-tRNA(Gln) amidotransferase A subunit family amidase